MWNQHKGNGKALTCNAAGSKPTADISEVLPPTQSNIGNRANHPSILAVLSNREFSWVIATPCKTDRAVSQIMNCSCSHRSNMWKGCMIKQKLTAHDSWTRCNRIIKISKNLRSKPVSKIPAPHLGRLSVLRVDHCGFQVCLHSVKINSTINKFTIQLDEDRKTKQIWDLSVP